jgi:hypothetical protein
MVQPCLDDEPEVVIDLQDQPNKPIVANVENIRIPNVPAYESNFDNTRSNNTFSNDIQGNGPN